jgi:hypothetical protein
MRSEPFHMESDSEEARYTHLFACISQEDEEDAGYTVQVKLYNTANPAVAAWGEEIADCFETAAMLVSALAAEFSIAQARIKIEVRMHNIAEGTQH